MSALSVNLQRKVSIIHHFQIPSYKYPFLYSFEELDRTGELIRRKHEESQASSLDRERQKGWTATGFIKGTEFRFEAGSKES